MSSTGATSARTSQPAASNHGGVAQFGANEWLVEDMYQRYLDDPSSVDPAWHEFFTDYRPPIGTPARPDGAGQPAASDNGAVAAPPEAPPKAPQEAPRQPAQPTPAQPAPTTAAAPIAPTVEVDTDGELSPLRGAAALVVKNMQTSLTVPTATSVRSVPAKLLADNRVVINNHLRRTRGGKISFTHVIGFALVRALADQPAMNRHFAMIDGKPTIVDPEHVNLGLAIDLPGKNGRRSLVVASIKNAEGMSFATFHQAYEDIIRRARGGQLTADDFAHTTISLTNPGTLGTNHSVPRLMAGQGTILGVGAMEYPAAFQGASDERLAELGVSKIITLTSTYDHRIIQGAESGAFLRPDPRAAARRGRVLRRDLRLAPGALRAGALGQGHPRGHRRQDGPGARADRRLPHPRPPDGRHRPAELPPAPPPRPRRAFAQPHALGPRPGVRGRRVRRPLVHEAARRDGRAARRVLPHDRHRVHAHQPPRAARLAAGAARGAAREAAPPPSRSTS